MTQGFTTGSDTYGYVVASVGIYIKEVNFTGTEAISVEIRQFDDGETDNLGALVAALTTPATLTADAVNEFAAPSGTTLEPDTTYLLNFVGTGDSAADLKLASTAIDADTSIYGWTIEDALRIDGALSGPGLTLSIIVKGKVVSGVLVSNLGQTPKDPSTYTQAFNTRAQVFRTGSNSAGYHLSGVDIGSIDDEEDPFTAAIWTVDAARLPDTLLYSLTGPSSFANSSTAFTFTAPDGATLEGGTNYAVVVRPGAASTGVKFTITESARKDSGASAGWSIRNKYRFVNSSDAWQEVQQSENLMIAVNGTAAIADTTVPVLSTATVDGASLVLTYDEDLDTGSAADQSAYSVTVGSASAAQPSGVDISGKTVTLTLSTAVTVNDAVTVSYTVPPSNQVQDAAGNDAAALADETVANNTGLTVVWSAALTVGRSHFNGEGYCSGVGIDSCGWGSLNDADFTLDGVTYTVGSVRWGDYTLVDSDYSALHLTLDADFPTEDVSFTILRVGAHDFLLTDAEHRVRGQDDLDHNYRWQRSDAPVPASIRALETGDTVAVAILQATNPNSAPAFASDAADTIMVDENTASGTDVGAAYTAADGEGDTLTYTLSDAIQNSGDAAAFTFSSTGQIATGPSTTLDFESKSTYDVKVELTDGKDGFGEADPAIDDTLTLAIVVQNVDEDEIVTITGTLEVGQTLTASLSGGDDNPDITTDDLSDIAWQWSRSATQSGTYTEISGETSATYTLADGDQDQYLRATATYNDVHTTDDTNVSQTAFGTTTQVGLANDPPVFDEGLATMLSVAENTAANVNVGSAYTATDGDNDVLSYTLTDTVASSGDAGAFTITTAGQIRTSGALDYEDKSSYSVTVNVGDGKDASGTTEVTPAVDASLKITINVTDMEEAGVVSVSGTARGGQTLSASLDDDDGGVTSLTWQWTRASAVNGTYTDISGATSASYTLVAADVGQYLKAEASYTDRCSSGKSATSMATAQIAANNVEPSFDSATATRSIAENTTAETTLGAAFTATDGDSDTLVYSLTGADAGSFTLNTATGQLSTKAGVSYDYEEQSSYSVTVNVGDNKDAAGDPDMAIDDSMAIIINVTDVDEDGVVSVSGTARGGQTLSASLDDDDGGVTSLTWQWTRASAVNGTYTDISGATSASYTLVAADVGQYLKAEASYTDRCSSGKSATSMATAQIAANNVEPSFDSATATRSIAENTTAETTLGAAFTATDGDSDTLVYSLTGADAGSFTLNTATGQLSTKAGVSYDYEEQSSYSVTVNVGDNKDAAGDPDTAIDDSIAVTVNLTNVDEDGVVTIAGTLDVGEELTATLVDPDGSVSNQSGQWSRSATQSGTYTEISGETAATYTLADTDRDQYLRATVTYRDGQSTSLDKSASSTSGQIGATPDTASYKDIPGISVPECRSSGIFMYWEVGINYKDDPAPHGWRVERRHRHEGTWDTATFDFLGAASDALQIYSDEYWDWTDRSHQRAISYTYRVHVLDENGDLVSGRKWSRRASVRCE